VTGKLARKAGVVVIALGAGAQAHAFAQDPTVCAELAAIVGEARTGFLALRGEARRPALDGDERFSAARALPGASECDITVVEPDWVEYACAWYLADPAGLDRQYAAFTEAVRGCFAGFELFDEPERRLAGGDPRIRPASLKVRISDAVELMVRRWSSRTTSGRTRIVLTVYYVPR